MSTAVASPNPGQAMPAVLTAVPLDAESASVNIPLSKIVASKTNRRHVRNAEKDAELAESIKMRGVVQPIVVRPIKATLAHATDVQPHAPFAIGEEIYEVVCGHRRFECSQKAGRKTIPAVVRKLANAEALEIQNIENLQREDLDPVDRAWAIRDLHDQYLKGFSKADAVKKLASTLNCKERNVHYMMSLATLSPEAQAALRKGDMSASHGYLIAPLPEDVQKRAISECRNWKGEFGSVRELREWIDSDVFTILDAAAFKKDDAKLVPEAGACTACQKNTAVNPSLSPDAKKATCTDTKCYEKKQQAHLEQIEKAMKQSGEGVVRVSEEYGARSTKNDKFIRVHFWKEAKVNSCKSAKPAVVIDGDRTGQRIIACTNQKCGVHFPRQSYSSPAPRKISAADKKRAEEIERKEKAEVRCTSALLKAVAAKAKMDKLLIRSLAVSMMDAVDDQIADFEEDFNCTEFIQNVVGWPAPKDTELGYRYGELAKIAQQRVPKMNDQALTALMVLLATLARAGTPPRAVLKELAASYKVDIKKIQKQAMDALKAEEKAKMQTSAQKMPTPIRQKGKA